MIAAAEHDEHGGGTGVIPFEGALGRTGVVAVHFKECATEGGIMTGVTCDDGEGGVIASGDADDGYIVIDGAVGIISDTDPFGAV